MLTSCPVNLMSTAVNISRRPGMGLPAFALEGSTTFPWGIVATSHFESTNFSPVKHLR